MKHLLQQIIAVLKKGFLYVLTGSVLVKAIGAISGIVIARIVDKAAYAHYAYALNLYAYLSMFTGLGLSYAIQKFCSSSGDDAKNKSYLLYALKVGSAFDLLLSLVLCIVISVVNIPFPQARKYIYAMVFLQAATYFMSVVQSYNMAYMQFKRYAAMGVIQAIVVCVFGIILTILMDIYGVILARYIGICSAAWVGMLFLIKQNRGIRPTLLTKNEKAEFYKVGISLTAVGVFSMAMPLNESFLINNIICDETVTANFKVAGQLPDQLYLITHAISVYFFPQFSKMRDGSQIWRKMKSIGLVVCGCISLLTITGVAITPLLLKIMYGEKYMDAVQLSYLLWIVRGVNAAIRMVPFYLLPALGKNRFNVLITGVSCGVHLVMEYFLITICGISGIAYASIAVYLVSGIIIWWYVWKVCKQNQFGQQTD